MSTVAAAEKRVSGDGSQTGRRSRVTLRRVAVGYDGSAMTMASGDELRDATPVPPSTVIPIMG